jgi:hypothetical protein
MKRICPREDELLDALARGFVGPELESHIQGCAACTELDLVAGALLDERKTALGEAPVPSAATMWWRMQLRMRQEVQSVTRRSLLVGQAATIFIAVIIATILIGADFTAGAIEVLTALRSSTPALVIVSAWMLLAPVAGWVAIRQK